MRPKTPPCKVHAIELPAVLGPARRIESVGVGVQLRVAVDVQEMVRLRVQRDEAGRQLMRHKAMRERTTQVLDGTT